MSWRSLAGTKAGASERSVLVKSELASRMVDGLKKAGVDFVSFLPESRMSDIIPLMLEDDSFTVVRASHEGSAVSIASGAALVGRLPAVYMESTGLMLSLYNLQTIPIRSGLPVLLLVSHVGSAPDLGNNYTFSGYGMKMEPVLDAMAIQYEVLEDDYRLVTRITDMARAARAAKQPACLLFTGDFTIFSERQA